MTELDAGVGAREDVEALADVLREASAEIGSDVGVTYRTHVARRLLASAWLAAHDEGVRAAERERHADMWDEGWDAGHRVGYVDAIDPDAPSLQRHNPYRR